jgi:glycosyltransferase involved in cell wall biosynthesis
MGNLSIIVPAYREPFLNKTLESLLENTVGDFEIIPVFNGYVPEKPLVEDSRINPIFLEGSGMRLAINAGLSAATGDYIMKADAHCLFAPGFNKVLMENCEPNWLVIPRRYSLDLDNWCIDKTRPPRDYHYLSFPGVMDINYGYSMQCVDWYHRTKERKEFNVDDTMTFQGSLWLADRKHFMKTVGLLDAKSYGEFGLEYEEIGLKYWLSGGANKVIKNTWYAHLSKRKKHYMDRLFSRKYKKGEKSVGKRNWSALHWINDEEPNMTRKFEWLIDKFSPIPGWGNGWKKDWEIIQREKM